MTGRIDLGATFDQSGVINRPDVGLGNTTIYGTFAPDGTVGSSMLSYVVQCIAATTTNLAATYSNGTAGLGATLTLTATGVLTLDSFSLAGFAGRFVLVKDQTDPKQNGIYCVVNPGAVGVNAVLMRAFVMNLPAQCYGIWAAVSYGSTLQGTLWKCSGVVTAFGTDNVLFVALSLGGGGGVIGAQWEATNAVTPGIVKPIDRLVQNAGTIQKVTILTTGGTGSCVIDIKKGTYAAFPPISSICAAALPTISGGIKYQDATLTGWTRAVSAGDILRFTLSSNTSFTRIAIFVEIT